MMIHGRGTIPTRGPDAAFIRPGTQRVVSPDAPAWGRPGAVGLTASDPAVLRRAAVILRQRARRPKSILLRAFVRTLTDLAAHIEAED